MSKALATKNVAAVALALAMVFGFAFAFAKPAHADALTDLQAQVQALLAQIASLQGGSSTTTGGACFTFTQTLTVGSKGAEVMQLQKFLNNHGFTVAATGAGSPGNETSTFGPATKAAVMKFQAGNGVSPAAGYFGAISRAKANSMCSGTTGGTTGGTTTTAGGNLVVAAGAQPANSLAPAGASRVPFTTFTLTNTSNAAVTVNGVTVQRTGLAQDAVFSGIVLVDSNNIQVGTSKTLNSLHQTTVGDTFTVQPGQTMTLTVAGNMGSSLGAYAGQVAGLTVTGVNVVSGTVGGSLPISGAMQTINSTLSLGSVSTSTSAFDPGTTQQRNIGDTAVRFSGIKFSAGSTEDLKLYSIRWRQVGSASASDLANVVTIVDGTSYPTTVDATGKYYSTVFPGGHLIAKGNSADVYIQGDLVGSNSANRTADFDIDKVTDVYFVGQLYGYGVAPSGTYTPWYNGYVVTINAGTVTTISKANEVAAQNVAVNVSNQPLGGYATNFAGEPVSVQSQVFTIGTSSASTGLLTNVSIVDSNGAIVAGPVDATWSSGSMIVTFTDTVTYLTGRHVYTLKGKVPSSASNGAVITVSTTPSSNWTNVTGQTTGNTVSLSNTSTVTMNAMTVKAGALTVTMAPTPASQNITAGVSGFIFANVQLDASQSGEDVRLAAVPVNFTGNANNLNGCQIYDGATALNTGSRVLVTISGVAKNTFSFDNSLVVPKGAIKSLAIKCDLSSSATSSTTYRFSTDTTTTDYSVTGVGSGSTITPSVTSANAGLMTVQTATLAESIDSSSPSFTVGSGGTAGVTDSVIKFRSANDTVTLTRIGLSLASGAAGDVTLVHLLNSAGSELGTATFGTGQTVATSTVNVSLPADTDVKITVKVDLADIGTGKAGTQGNEVRILGLNAEGNSSSGTVYANGTGSVGGVRVYNSFPTFTYDTTTGTLFNGVDDLLTLNVAADSMGDVALYKLQFKAATSTVTVLSPTFNGPNGSVGTVSAPDATNIITVTFDSTSNTSDAVVGAGTTKTYVLRGTVAGLTGSNSGTVSTQLLADTGTTTFAAAASASGKNIWSPMSTSTSPDVNNNEWTNSYGLKGCFQTVGLGTNCTARVLAK